MKTKEGKRLEIIALANYVDYSKNGKFNITGIFDEVYSDKFPISLLRGFLAFTITGFSPGEKAIFNARIKDPEQKEILKTEFTINAGKNGKGNFFIEIVNLSLPIPGDYKISVCSEEKELGFTYFKVMKASNNESAKS
ncbi:Gmad2 immunoglobulin-like domain-containing protein [Patescibacteria group bacterium]|nr:Gmad2 immunoglobulin-like domain-containing protein [Patescibacteria group bacterium]